MSDPVAYTYEADHHCPPCTVARFGVDESGYPPEDARDREGNGLGVIAPWDEWMQFSGEYETLNCNDCGAELATYDPDLVRRW